MDSTGLDLFARNGTPCKLVAPAMSRYFQSQKSKKPHLLRAGGVAAEVNDVRTDIEAGFLLVESEVDTLLAGSSTPGQPIYDVTREPFNAVANGAADDTAALNAAIAAANVNPGIIYLGRSHRITSALTAITNNNISLIGRGEFNGGTIIRIDAAVLPSEVLLVTGQYALIENIWFGAPFQGLDTTSRAIRLNAYRPTLRNVVVSMFGNGIFIDRCNTAYLENCQVTDVLGSYMYLVQGQAPGSFCHNTQFVRCGGGQAYPLTLVGPHGVWAQSTAYSVGNVVMANGKLWQCSTAGTSAGSGTGPSALPSTNPSLVHVTPVVDGTAQWRFAMGAFDGYRHGSFAHTVMYDRCGSLQGRRGMYVFDDAGNAPTFIHSWQFSSDHPLEQGVFVEACDGAVMFDQTLAVSVLRSGFKGIDLGANATRWQINGGESNQGVNIAGTAGIVRGIHTSSIDLASTADEILVKDNHCTGAITIAAGADNYIVRDNYVPSGVTNTPGIAETRIVSDNIGQKNRQEINISIAGDGTLNATRSSAGTTCTAAGSGQYNLTFPPCVGGVCFSQYVSVDTTSPGVFCIVEAPNYAAGTVSVQLSSGSNLAGGDTIDVMLRVF